MKKYDFYKEMFMVSEIYPATVKSVDCYKVLVELRQGGLGIMYQSNVPYEITDFVIGEEYDFEIIGFNSDGILSLIPEESECNRLGIKLEETLATVVAVSQTAIAFSIKGEILLYKTVLGANFFDLLYPEEQASIVLLSPTGDNKNPVIVDIKEFSVNGKFFRIMDYSYQKALPSSEKTSSGTLEVGQLVDLSYDPHVESYFISETGNLVIVEEKAVLSLTPLPKNLARITRFRDDDTPVVKIEHSWS